MTAPSSSQVFLSSEHGTRLNTSTFDVVMGGNTLNVKQTTRLTPTMIFMPNIFPNIKAPYNTFEWDLSVFPQVPFVLPSGQYDAGQLTSALNVALPLISVTFDTSTSRFTLTNTTGDGTPITINLSNSNLGRVLGFDTAGIVLADTASITGNEPNLGGERIVHINCDRLGHKNMQTSKDNSPRNILFSVPLHETPYGATACYVPGDHVAGDVDFLYRPQMDNLEFNLLDSDMQPLTLPSNYHVRMGFKIYHGD